jgi:opacity protein-like surface antigen
MVMKIIITALLFAIVMPSFAQRENEHNKHDMEKMEQFLPSVTRSIGGSFQQFDGLNARVANLPQYEHLKDYTATLGLGWMKEKDRFISDMGITIGSSLSRHRDEKSSTIRYIGFNANAGYDVLKDERITLYPLVGIGFQAYQAIFYKDNSAVDFDDVLQSPAVENSIHPVKFNNGFWVYRAGLGLSFKSPKHPSSSIGLQAGYTGSFQKRAWRSRENQSLRNAPKDRISQFYVSLILTSKPWMMMKK